MSHRKIPVRQLPTSRSSSLTLTAIAILSALMLSSSIQAQPLPGQPAERLDFPVTSPGVPAYARLELLIPGFDVPRSEQWAAVAFYRDPECIPANFDLGQFFHFPGPDGLGAFACQLLVEGHEIWENGPGLDLAPIYVQSRNAVPDLPIWFLLLDELAPLLDRGFVFLGEIESLPSLIRGRAWRFEESNYPNGTTDNPGLTLRADGRLENGGRFTLAWHFHPSAGEDEVIIEFGLPDTAPPGPPPMVCPNRPDLPFC
jgi:hypothetical protein